MSGDAVYPQTVDQVFEIDEDRLGEQATLSVGFWWKDVFHVLWLEDADGLHQIQMAQVVDDLPVAQAAMVQDSTLAWFTVSERGGGILPREDVVGVSAGMLVRIVSVQPIGNEGE